MFFRKVGLDIVKMLNIYFLAAAFYKACESIAASVRGKTLLKFFCRTWASQVGLNLGFFYVLEVDTILLF